MVYYNIKILISPSLNTYNITFNCVLREKKKLNCALNCNINAPLKTLFYEQVFWVHFIILSNSNVTLKNRTKYIKQSPNKFERAVKKRK